jgi:hypothetical protein
MERIKTPTAPASRASGSPGITKEVFEANFQAFAVSQGISAATHRVIPTGLQYMSAQGSHLLGSSSYAPSRISSPPVSAAILQPFSSQQTQGFRGNGDAMVPPSISMSAPAMPLSSAAAAASMHGTALPFPSFNYAARHSAPEVAQKAGAKVMQERHQSVAEKIAAMLAETSALRNDLKGLLLTSPSLSRH